jgi:hypothetical protein
VPALAELQKRIPARSAFVSYIPTSRALYLVLITNTAFRTALSSITKQELLTLTGEYVRVLSDAAGEREAQRPNAARLGELSARLHGIFLRPVERAVPGVQRLLVAFPLDMPLVPLHTLQAEGRRSSYALQRLSFRYSPDAECAAFERTHLPLSPHVVGFGNPGATSADVEYEVRDARVFFREAQLLFGRDAVPARLEKEPADLLHASMDIRFHAAKARASRLILRDASGYTGTHALPLGEVFALGPYNTILFSPVHQSAAHAVVARMFLMNGSSSLIMNSYTLPRKTKKRFNELFYADLVHDVTVEAAYRNALLSMLRDAQQREVWLWGSYFLW